MNLCNLKIGTRLGASIGTLLILMAVMAGVGLWGLQQGETAFQQQAKRLRFAQLAADWLGTLDSHSELVQAYLRGTDPAEMKRMEAKMAAQMTSVKEIRKTLEANTSEQARRKLAAVSEAASALDAARTEVLELKQRNNPEESATLAKLTSTKLLPAMQTYVARAGEYRDFANARADVAGAEASNVFDLAGKILIGGTLTALTLGGLLGWWVTRSITRPLAQAIAIAARVAEGDLTQRIEVSSRDEAGQLLRELATMSERLRSLVSEVRIGVESVSSASSQIATGNQDLSARTEQSAANLQQTAASTEDLATRVAQAADTASHANALASEAASAAQRGGEVVQQVVASMQQITESSKRINEIIGVIDGIAFQTNILALNAAVEAARAGEQGRGFAVVASEVRSLAQRSASAAKEIKNLIQTSADSVEVGSRQVAQAGQSMDEIVIGVRRVSSLIVTITGSAAEQRDGIGQINQSVSQLDQMTQQNAALVEEAAAAATSMRDQAQRLAEVVAVFRTDTAAPVASVSLAGVTSIG